MLYFINTQYFQSGVSAAVFFREIRQKLDPLFAPDVLRLRLPESGAGFANIYLSGGCADTVPAGGLLFSRAGRGAGAIECGPDSTIRFWRLCVEVGKLCSARAA